MTLNRPVFRSARFRTEVVIHRADGCRDTMGEWQAGEPVDAQASARGLRYDIPALTEAGWEKWYTADLDIRVYSTDVDLDERTSVIPTDADGSRLVRVSDGRYRLRRGSLDPGSHVILHFTASGGGTLVPSAFTGEKMLLRYTRSEIAVVQPVMLGRDTREEGGRVEGVINFFFASDVADAIRVATDVESEGDIIFHNNVEYRALDKKLWEPGSPFQGYAMVIADRIEGQ